MMKSKMDRPVGRFFYWPILIALIALWSAGSGMAATPAKTTVQDTVYRADGTVAQGTLLISWAGFTTAAGDAVAAGSMNVKIPVNGAVNIALVPNTGSTPASSYKVTLRSSDGVVSEEYWTVPSAATTTIGAIRSKVVPAEMAKQFVGRDYVDTKLAQLQGSGSSDAVLVSGSYSDPAWLTSLAATKLAGTLQDQTMPTSSARKDTANTWTAAQTDNALHTFQGGLSTKKLNGTVYADRYASIQEAIDDACAVNPPALVVIPNKGSDYIVTSTLTPCAFLRTHGSGLPKIVYTGTGQLWNVAGAQFGEIEGLWMVGAYKSDTVAIRMTALQGISPIGWKISGNTASGWGNISSGGTTLSSAALWNGTVYTVPDGAVMSGGIVSVEADSLGLKMDHNTFGGIGDLISFAGPADTASISENILGVTSEYPAGPCRALNVKGSDSGAVSSTFAHNNITCSGLDAVKINSLAQWVVVDNEVESLNPIVSCTAGNTTVCNPRATTYDFESAARLHAERNYGNSHGHGDSIFYIGDGIQDSDFVRNNGTSTGAGTPAWLAAHPGQIQHLFRLGSGSNNKFDHNDDGAGVLATYTGDYLGVHGNRSQTANASVFGCGDPTVFKNFIFCVPEVNIGSGDSKGINFVDSAHHAIGMHAGFDGSATYPYGAWYMQSLQSGVWGIPFLLNPETGPVVVGGAWDGSATPFQVVGNAKIAGTLNVNSLQVNGSALSASNLSNGVTGTGAVVLATGTAAAATALAANGTNCGANQYSQGVDANGNAEGCAQLSASSLSNGAVGSGAVVLATNSTLTTPNIGVATGTSLDLSKVTLSSAGMMTKYNNVATKGAGVGAIYGSAAPTAQGAAITVTNLYTATVGLYRVCYDVQVTRAATTSSSVGVTIGWNNGSAQTKSSTAIATNALNAEDGNCFVVNSAAANITYATTYASSGGTSMQYALRVTAEQLQ